MQKLPQNFYHVHSLPLKTSRRAVPLDSFHCCLRPLYFGAAHNVWRVKEDWEIGRDNEGASHPRWSNGEEKDCAFSTSVFSFPMPGNWLPLSRMLLRQYNLVFLTVCISVGSNVNAVSLNRIDSNVKSTKIEVLIVPSSFVLRNAPAQKYVLALQSGQSADHLRAMTRIMKDHRSYFMNTSFINWIKQSQTS